MAKNYDKILKENIEALFLPLTEKYLGLSIKSSQEITEKLQSTLEREPDFIRLVETSDNKKLILHMEFQTVDEPDMIYRMTEYAALILRKYQLPIRQFVIYLGNQAPKMKSSLPPGQSLGSFELTDLQQFDYQELVRSQVPEEVILAILSNFKGRKPEHIVGAILERLKEVSKQPILLQKYVKQLGILSRLRNLEKVIIKKSTDMPITYDKENDSLYKEGRNEATLEMVEKMLRSGILTIEQVAELSDMAIEDIQKIQEEIDRQV